MSILVRHFKLQVNTIFWSSLKWMLTPRFWIATSCCTVMRWWSFIALCSYNLSILDCEMILYGTVGSYNTVQKIESSHLYCAIPRIVITSCLCFVRRMFVTSCTSLMTVMLAPLSRIAWYGSYFSTLYDSFVITTRVYWYPSPSSSSSSPSLTLSFSECDV